MPDTEPTLDVVWLLPDGQGGGRTARGTFKVRGALPGDRIVPVTSRSRGRTLEVERFTWASQGPREAHPCTVIDRCGGCDLGRMPGDRRKDALLRMVRQSLRLDADPAWLAPSVGHRSRVKLALDGSSVGYRAARSHDLVAIETCHAAHPLIQREISHLLDDGPIDGASSIELRTDGQRVVGVLDAGSPGPADLPRILDLAVGGRTVRGDPSLMLSVAGMALRASPLSFFQVDAAGNELLVGRVLENVVRVAPERVLDLYAGIGNLTLPVARTGVPTVAVELEGQATRDLAFNEDLHGLSIPIHTADVGRFDTTRVPFDMVLLDPPRAGAPGVIDRLLIQRPRAIQIVSCHVPSAARDLKPAIDAGYRITDVAVVDLFPGTHHIETLILLQR